MKKKIGICVAIIFMAFTIVTTASTINGMYEGFPIVNVMINGKKVESEVPAVNFYGKTVLPVRDIAETLKAIVEWDGETWTANLIKPHIDMIFAQNIISNEQSGNEFIVNVFKSIPVSSRNAFYTYVQMDGFGKGKHTYRIAIVDPRGNVIHTTKEYSYLIQDGNTTGLDFVEYFVDIPFDRAGVFKFQFQLKHHDVFKTIYEKELVVY